LAWYRLAGACRRLELSENQAAANKKMLSLVRTRFANGQSGRADVLRQQQLAESARERVRAGESEVRVLQNQLSVLLGKPPEKTPDCESCSLPSLPPLPDTGVPSGLIGRRPDVREARMRLMAAGMDFAASEISRYPRLAITASASSSDTDASDPFDDWLRSLAANLTLPLIDGGRRKAEADMAEAVKNQRLYEYGQAVLEAFREVEDALVREEKQKKRVNLLEKQAELAQNAADQLKRQYLNGDGNYLDVLSAVTEKQQTDRDLVSAEQELVEYRIGLYRALAGGFETKRQPGGSREKKD
ncbi:MAG: TolC family protein, partial [Desulfobacterales bacterium]